MLLIENAPSSEHELYEILNEVVANEAHVREGSPRTIYHAALKAITLILTFVLLYFSYKRKF